MTIEQQVQTLMRNTEEVLPEGALIARLRKCEAAGRPLRVKQGFDPTAPDIHLGHTVGLRKLREFQDLGHQVVLIIGDYTGMVGDPSGRSKTRPQLSAEQVRANAQTYLDQFHRVVDRSPSGNRLPVEIHWNGEWFAKMGFMEVMRLASQYTVARILEREDFTKRFRENQPISMHELFYPLMQGFDSVAIHADVEIGGTEQKFNLIVGRALQELHDMEPQVVMTMPVLPGLDGRQRMGKSLGNYIGVTDSPREMFGKVMSLPDDVMMLFWRLVSDADAQECASLEGELSRGVNPMILKKRLASRLVRMYHDQSAALSAQESFEAQFSRREVPSELQEVRLPAGDIWIQHLLVRSGLAKSSSDARRAIEGEGSVEIESVRMADPTQHVQLSAPIVVRRGRRMVRVVPEVGR